MAKPSRFFCNSKTEVSIILMSIWIFVLVSCKTSMKYSYELSNDPVFKGDYIPSFKEFIFQDEKSILDSISNLRSVKDENIYFQTKGEYRFIRNGKREYRGYLKFKNDTVRVYSLPNRKKEEIKIVSYNIEFALDIDNALKVLSNPELNDVDILLLQEMDEDASKAIANELNMCYVYFPAIKHPAFNKNVGNAILSKWPIISSRKVKLPHPSIYPKPFELTTYKFRKLATVAKIMCLNRTIYFYSTHAAAFNTTKNRKDIAMTLSHDAISNGYKHCVVGGDFNSMGKADIEATITPFIRSGFDWSSQSVGQSIGKIRWFLSFLPGSAFVSDHIFTLGFETVDSGKVEAHEVSDHSPIWVKLKLTENNHDY